ncbi:MAG: hypothetical protein Q7J27_07860 [Syntrophales bacterium]|nr:hypothetical protein [Syntrophales bacterium]
MITLATNFVPLFMLTVILMAILRFLSKHIMLMLYRLAGWKGVIITGWIGTFFHEMSHALTAVLFGHKITAFRPYVFDTSTGALGYVGHSWNSRSVYQRSGLFFIAISPCILGTIAVYFLAVYLVPNAHQVVDYLAGISWIPQSHIAHYLWSVILSFPHFLGQLFALHNFVSFKYWVFLFIAGSLIIHMVPSTTDLRNAVQGMFILFLLIFCVLFWAWLLGVDEIAVLYIYQFAALLNFLLALACLFSLACYLLFAAIAFLEEVGVSR